MHRRRLPGPPQAIILLLGVLGCLERSTLELPLAADERAIVAVTEKVDGELRVTGAVVVSPEKPAPLSLGRADPVGFVWTVSPSDFVHADGRPVTLEELDDLSVGASPEERRPGYGGCGRCLSPWSTAPQPVHAGDSCSVPSFSSAAVIVAEEGGLALRQDLGEHAKLEPIARALTSLHWPGDCACERPEDFLPEGSYDFFPAPSRRDPNAWPLEALALTPDGGLGGFSERAAVYVPPSGEARLLEVSLSGPVLGAVAIDIDDDPAFLVAAASQSLLSNIPEYYFVKTTPELSTTGARIVVEPRFRPDGFKPIDSKHFRIIGGADDGFFRTQNGAFVECEVQEDLVSCGEIHAARGCLDEEQRIVDLDVFADRFLVAPLAVGGLIVGERVGGAWQLDCLEDITVDTSSVTGRPSRAAFGELYLCGAGVLPNGLAYVCFTAQGQNGFVYTDLSQASGLDDLRQWRQAEGFFQAGGAFRSQDFALGPGPDELTYVTPGGTTVICDGSGACHEQDEAFPGVDGHLSSITRPIPGWTVGTTYGETYEGHPAIVYVRRDGEPFAPVWGRLPYDRTIVRPLVVGLDGVARHLSRAGVIELRHRAGRVETTTRAYARLDATLVTAALDTSEDEAVRGSFLAVGQADPAKLFRIWPDPARWEVVAELPELSPCDLSNLSLSRIVEDRPGELVIMGHCGTVLRVAGGVVKRLELEGWDDPFTPEVEQEPPGLNLRTLDAAQGLTWIGGTNATAFRVHGDRMERVALRRSEEVWPSVDTALVNRAYCADDVLFASPDVYVRVRPSRALVPGGFLDVEPFMFLLGNESVVRSEFRQRAHFMLGPPKRLVVLTEGAWALQQLRATRSLVTPWAAVQDDNGDLWLGGADRRIVVGVLE